MMSHRKARMGKSHDFGMPATAGKGDKDRVADLATFNANFAAINFTGPPPEGFVKVGHKIIKKYGNS